MFRGLQYYFTFTSLSGVLHLKCRIRLTIPIMTGIWAGSGGGRGTLMIRATVLDRKHAKRFYLKLVRYYL